jgi:single-strand DNA-binding protein
MGISITVSGNLGRDAEIKQTRNGKTYTSFNMAHTPREKKDGEWQNGETVWFRVTYWGELPAVFLSTGSKVLVSGDFKQETYDKDGVTRTVNAITADKIGSLIDPVRQGDSGGFVQSTPVTNGWLEVSDDTPF